MERCGYCGGQHDGGTWCTRALSSPTRNVASPIGQMVGGYRVEAELARGGMGIVYRAVHPLIGTEAAIKVLREDLGGSPELVERFYLEARAAVTLNHPGSVRIYDLSSLPDGRPCIVMEFLRGETLESRAQKGPLPLADALPLLTQLCEVLACAHDKGIIHRDIKTDNVLLVPRDGGLQVKLLDFGVARATMLNAGGTMPGMVLGTPEYMAPEQALGEIVDHRADLYSLGVLAYRVLTGRLPFEARSAHEAMLKRIMEEPQQPTGVEAPIAQVLMKSLARGRDERYQSAREFSQALEAVHAQVSQSRRAVSAFTARMQGTALVVEFPTALAWLHAAREEISRGRLYVPMDNPPERVTELRVWAPGHAEEIFTAEIALRPSPEQARIWKLPYGIGLALRRIPGAPRDPRTPMRPAMEDQKRWTPADETLARQLQLRGEGDHYQFLGIPSDADTEAVRTGLRQVQRHLARLKELTASPGQRDLLHSVALRFDRAFAALSQLEARATYDAELGNYRGVARTIAAGLRADALEALRSTFEARLPMRMRQAAPHRLAADVHLRENDPFAAVQALEKALELDPLHFEDQRRYWALQRRIRMGPRAVVEAPSGNLTPAPLVETPPQGVPVKKSSA